MSKIYLKKNNQLKKKRLRLFGLTMFLVGIGSFIYLAFPFLSWKIYFEPAFASEGLTAPVPKFTSLASSSWQELFSYSAQQLSGVDYTNAENWFPNYHTQNNKASVPLYYLSIPKLGITNAEVSTEDMDLAKHLVHYGGTAVPPQLGNAVIFGHSTLPQLFNQTDYKTIFATVHKLKVADVFNVTVSDVTYTYKIRSISITDADDTSVLTQQYDDSYVTIITCTPPGTIWKRLIIKATLQKL
jgi:sortase A